MATCELSTHFWFLLQHYVEGMVMPDAGSIGMNYKFVLEGGEESVTLCAVEELALDHYKKNGYLEGTLTGKILNHHDT